MTVSSDGAECPYCEDINHVEMGDLNLSANEHQTECSGCKKAFVFSIDWVAWFCSERKDIHGEDDDFA